MAARRPTVGFLGWFGPRGLASIVFAVILVEEGGLPHDDMITTAIVITIVLLAKRIAGQAKTAEQAVEIVRQQTAELGGIARINDSGVRILHSARALRKAAVGK